MRSAGDRSHLFLSTKNMLTDNSELRIEDCVNQTCPWSGDPVRADALTVFQGQVVGFCNSGCRDKFVQAICHFEAAAQRNASKAVQ